MDKKVILVSVDGMRPDGFESCGSFCIEKLKRECAYTLRGRSVMPSVTLPCHMTMFHGVAPERHGITTNLYMPQVRPVEGLCERLRAAGKTCAFFYNWHELRDLVRPGSLAYSVFFNMYQISEPDRKVTDAAVRYIAENQPDFAFVYLGETDEAGHHYGWMTSQYLGCIARALECVCQIMSEAADYTVIVTADHGGHERTHGTDMPEDMTIPMFVRGNGYEVGETLNDAGILDLAKTIAAILGVSPSSDWEGKVL